ncbi:unnamed protein product [Clonostachys rosea f. rosea IK726]|uniref:Uncharacterized protein n=1 Tax=Clonostachys rosea f. rosea IK726 TaxID=1349383 RepID=A0ACA9U346_BIOOC|nr:unnamed protein product [Clonostachys rosea f. rosea IK726]
MERRSSDSSSAMSSVNAARRISNLTAEQAEKKRAIDRDNQRHHRAKNKAYIRSLEGKILELTGRLREAEQLIDHYESEKASNGKGVQGPYWSTTLSPPPSLDLEHSEPSAGMHTARAAPIGHRALYSLPLEFGTGITINTISPSQDIRLLDLGLGDGFGEFNSRKLSDSTTISHSPTSASLAADEKSLTPSFVPDWQRVPPHLAPTTKLDEVIKNITEAWNSRYQKSGKQAEFSASVFPSISSLLNRPDDLERDWARSFSNAVAAQVFRSTVKTLAERIGFMYTLSHLIRWLVCRSKETYEKMPVMLRPTELQLKVPHPAWIDVIVWPEARNAIIKDMDWGRFEELRELSGASLTVSWPYEDSTAFIESPDKQTMLLHPVFEAHLQNPSNWRWGEKVGKAFPFLQPFCSG